MIGQKGVPSRSGGIEIHVEELGTRLVKMGHEVIAYSRKEYCKEICDSYHGITIEYVPNIDSKHLDTITYSLVSTIKAIRSGAQIIHFHASGPSIFAFLPRLFGRKVICTFHGLDWKREKWGYMTSKVLKLGEAVAMRFADGTISVSESLLDYFDDTYHKIPIYIPNGVEVKAKPASQVIQDKFGLEEGQYILFLSRIVPEKGLHYLIEAYNQIETDKKLVIAGGNSHSEKYFNFVLDMGKDNPNILFTNFVEGDVLEQLYANAYIYVLPSTVEGLPISLLEAMSYGTCCFTSDIEENMEVIRGYGYTFHNKDVDNLKDVLVQILEGKTDYNGDAVIEYIREKYSWDAAAIQTELMYQSLFDTEQPSPL